MMRMAIEQAHMNHLKKTEKMYTEQLKTELQTIQSQNGNFVDELAYMNANESSPDWKVQPPSAKKDAQHCIVVLPSIKINEEPIPPAAKLGQSPLLAPRPSALWRPKSGSKVSRRNSRSVASVSEEVLVTKMLSLEELSGISANPGGFIASLGSASHLALQLVEKSLSEIISRVKQMSDLNDEKQRALKQIYNHFTWKRECLNKLQKQELLLKSEAGIERSESEIALDGEQSINTQSIKPIGYVESKTQYERSRQLWLVYLHSKLLLGRFGLTIRAINTLKPDLTLASKFKEAIEQISSDFYNSALHDHIGASRSSPKAADSPRRLLLFDESSIINTKMSPSNNLKQWIFDQQEAQPGPQIDSAEFEVLELKLLQTFDQMLQLLKLVREESQRRKTHLYMITGKSESNSLAVTALKSISKNIRIVAEDSEVTQDEFAGPEGSSLGEFHNPKLKRAHEWTDESAVGTSGSAKGSSTGKMGLAADGENFPGFLFKANTTLQSNPGLGLSPKKKSKKRVFLKQTARPNNSRSSEQFGTAWTATNWTNEEPVKQSPAKELILQKATARLALDLNGFSPAAQRAKGFKLLLKDYFQRIRGMKEEQNFNFKNLDPIIQGSDVKGLHRERGHGDSRTETRDSGPEETRGNSSEFRITSLRKKSLPLASVRSNSLSSANTRLDKSDQGGDHFRHALANSSTHGVAFKLSLRPIAKPADEDLDGYLAKNPKQQLTPEGLLPLFHSKAFKKPKASKDNSLLVRKPLHRSVLVFPGTDP